MKTIKNWWLTGLGIVVIVLDQGFDLINPLILDYNLSPQTIASIKIIFGIYAMVKLKTSLPTQNLEKLQSIIGDSTPPRDKDEK